MSRVFEVVTPEQVAIRYELAGFGSRAIAAIVDSFFQLLILLVVGIIISLFLRLNVGTVVPFFAKINESVLIGLFLLMLFVITWGYYIAFETLWQGATPGKRMMGLRVMKDGGHPVDFRAVLIRNLIRIVDVLPGMVVFVPLYAVGFVAMVASNEYKRLGDMAAGTLVVLHGREDELREQIGFGEVEVLRLLDPSILGLLSRITREELRIVQLYLSRRNQLSPALRLAFAEKIATPLMHKIDYPIPEYGVDHERWLGELVLASRNRTFGPAASKPAPTSTSLPEPAMSTPPAGGDDVDDRRW